MHLVDTSHLPNVLHVSRYDVSLDTLVMTERLVERLTLLLRIPEDPS
jgi:hypothetical protein